MQFHTTRTLPVRRDRIGLSAIIRDAAAAGVLLCLLIPITMAFAGLAR